MARTKGFSAVELSGFCSQVAVMLKSGISLQEGMYMLSEEVEEERTKQILRKVEGTLKDSGSFYDALKDTGCFPAYCLNMVRIGEVSGKLEEVMVSLAHYYEREDTIRDSIRNVIAYPMMMFFMIAVILTALVGKILPMFQSVFVNLNVDVAASSSRLMNFGIWTGRVVAIFSLVVLVGALLLFLWYQTAGGRKRLYQFVCCFFATRKTVGLLAVGRFVSSMSVMVTSGLDTAEAMKMAGEVVEHPAVEKKIANCLKKMKDRTSFSEAVREEKLLDGMQGRMLAVADKTGMLDQILGEISAQYDEKIADQLGQFCTRLETCLVLGLSVIVGGVLLSVMFPLVSIISSL